MMTFIGECVVALIIVVGLYVLLTRVSFKKPEPETKEIIDNE